MATDNFNILALFSAMYEQVSFKTTSKQRNKTINLVSYSWFMAALKNTICVEEIPIS